MEAGEMNMEKRSVFITGAAGGLGRATSTYFASRNWTVFAADCDRKALAALENTPNIVCILLDVGKAASVEAAYRQVSSHVEALAGVINMAGVIEIGSMLEVEESSILHLFNINVLGMFRVNKIFLPLILEGRGRIINISSENGWESGGPFNGAYALSKHAVEAYTDSLRRESLLLGIKVIKIQPGPFKTNFVMTAKQLFIEETGRSTHFKPQLEMIARTMDGVWKKANPPGLIARLTYRAMTVRRPKTVYSVRPEPQMVLLDLLPVRWADGLLKMVLEKQ
jgi:NAD(P)-dependent dehydrogenase (short-subunit alcohol dehydrogenase family)